MNGLHTFPKTAPCLSTLPSKGACVKKSAWQGPAWQGPAWDCEPVVHGCSEEDHDKWKKYLKCFSRTTAGGYFFPSLPVITTRHEAFCRFTRLVFYMLPAETPGERTEESQGQRLAVNQSCHVVQHVRRLTFDLFLLFPLTLSLSLCLLISLLLCSSPSRARQSLWGTPPPPAGLINQGGVESRYNQERISSLVLVLLRCARLPE